MSHLMKMIVELGKIMPPKILLMRRLAVNLLGREKPTSERKNKQFKSSDG